MSTTTVHHFKRGDHAETKGTPAMGGFPPVEPEPVRIVRAENHAGSRWLHVEFADGGRLLMHPSNLQPVQA